MEQQRGFFAALFDFSFRSLIGPRVVRVAYGITVVLAGLLALAFLVSGLSQGQPVGIVFGLVIGPLYFLLLVVYARVFLEVLMVLFRINDNVERLAQGAAAAGSGTPPPPPPPPVSP